MPFTTREIESPDPVTRVAAADATLRHPEDDIGEKMVLNMGPSHPATHGVLRLVLELDGEIITKATPDIGFLHRGDEKIAENMQYNQFVPYTDRLDYLAPLSNNVAYALAVEKLMGWEIPPRGKAIRTICCETSRISSHLMGVGAMAVKNTVMRDRAFRTTLDILESGDFNHTYFPTTVGLLTVLAMAGDFPVVP